MPLSENKVFRADLYAYTVPLNFTAFNQPITQQVNILPEGDFELFYLLSSHAARYFFQLQDTSSAELVFNQRVPSDAITGIAQFPFELPVTRIFQRNRTITIDAVNSNILAGNAGDLVLLGATLQDTGAAPPESNYSSIYYPTRPDGRRPAAYAQFFAFAVELNFNVGANQRITQALQVFNDKPFELFAMCYTHAQLYSLQLQDASSGKLFFNTPLPINMVAGVGQRPFRLPNSRVIRANGSLVINAVNSPTSGIHTGHLVFIGANLISK
jgi:hypothetical protein